MKLFDSKTRGEDVGLPIGNRFVKFSPLSMFRHGNNQGQVLLIWIISCVLIIPSGMLTRIFEWTGVSLEFGTVSVYLTFYLPMLFCVLLVMWLGFWWAAIPAYLSTFCVALLGGMPMMWIAIFSLANPIGLAMYAMFYRVTPLRTDLHGLESVVGFVMIALVASLAGSIGAFIWALTNDVGLNAAHPVWLGWWLGGWLQTLFFVAPILYVFGPAADRKLAHIKNSYLHLNNARGAMLAMITSFITILVCFVLVGRVVGLQQMKAVDWGVGESLSLEQAQNIVDSLSYPLFILLAVMIALSYLAYRAVMFWHSAMRGVNEKLTLKNEQLINLVNRDPLTGLFNRRKVFEQLRHDFARATRLSEPMSIIMVDADRFKLINDTHGHQVGDQVIQSIASVMQECMRQYDTAGRYGGEEFIAILPNTTLDKSHIIAERLMAAINHTDIQTDRGTLKVTVSVGIAALSKSDGSGESIIDRADKALLRAKHKGRNRAEIG